MIFRIFKIRNTIKELRADPGKFAGSELGELFLGIFLIPILVVVIFPILFFILGFTSLLGGPFGFFKVAFFLVMIPSVLFFFIIFHLYKLIKRSTKKSVNDTIKVESKVVE